MQSLPPIYGTFGNGSSTQTAGTAITSIIKPNNEVTLLYGLGSKGSGSLFGRGWVNNSTPAPPDEPRLHHGRHRPHGRRTAAAQLDLYHGFERGERQHADHRLRSRPVLHQLRLSPAFGHHLARQRRRQRHCQHRLRRLPAGRWDLVLFQGHVVLRLHAHPGHDAAQSDRRFANGLVLVNTPVFFFGQASDTIPAIGMTQWQTTTIASTNRQQLIADTLVGGVQSIFVGDPMLILSNNITAAGSLDGACGYFGKY